MSHAVDLPEGSIVATRNAAYIKGKPQAPYPWRSTAYDHRAVDEAVEDLLSHGAMVVRWGYELDGRPDTEQPVEAEFDGYAWGHHIPVVPDAFVVGES